MPYLVFHHGRYYFQLRVPRSLTDRYGRLIRQNLQTADKAVAQQMACRLASDWIGRFSFERHGLDDAALGRSPDPAPALSVELPETVREPQAGVSTPTGEVGPEDRPTSNQPPPGAALRIQDLYQYWQGLHRESPKSTLREFEAAARAFERTCKSSASELERTDIAAFRDRLLREGLAPATAAKKVSVISTLLQTGVDAGLLKVNVARGLRVPKPKVTRISRRSFCREELERIFNSPIYRDGVRPRGGGGSAAVWVPAIGLFSGARVEEICQLRVEDIVETPDYGLLIHIRDEHALQRLKTSQSRRIVPVHNALVAAGFANYWNARRAEGNEWLFPKLVTDAKDRRSGNWVKWFSRYLRNQPGCGITDRRLVFHSFRHTYKELCREAGVSEEVHDALTGHSGSTVGRSYGAVPVKTLVAAMAAIDVPVALPLLSSEA